MPLSKRWAKANESNLKRVPSNLGVYEVGHNKRIIRIGSGVIRDRVLTHVDGLPVTHFRYTETNNKVRAIQLERKHLKKYGSSRSELPKYNDEIPEPPR